MHGLAILVLLLAVVSGLAVLVLLAVVCGLSVKRLPLRVDGAWCGRSSRSVLFCWPD